MRRPTTLLIADDDPLYLEALCRRVEADDRLDLVGVATDGDEAVRACTAHRPDVALIGWYLSGPRGAALVEELAAASAATCIVVLAGGGRPSVVHAAVALGARGFLVKKEPGPGVLDALHRVSRGSTAFSPDAQATWASASVLASVPRSDSRATARCWACSAARRSASALAVISAPASTVTSRLADASPLDRVHLMQERLNLQAELATMDGNGVDLVALEDDFVRAAAAYGSRRGLSYTAWRDAGVPPAVLRRAGITRAR